MTDRAMEQDSDSTRSGTDALNSGDGQPVKLVIVGNKCRQDATLQNALKNLGIPVAYSNTGLEHIQEASKVEIVFVVSKFDDEIFHKLHRAEARIMAPPVILKSARNNNKLPVTSRALYCTSMRGFIVCFTGFSKQKLVKMADLIHHMGGSIRKDIAPKVTHLVANCTGGSKYRFAVSYGTPIMNEDWIFKTWELRDDITIKADCESLMKHRMKPFYKCCLSFHGFPAEEQRHMEEMTMENGGVFSSVGSDDCTHLVVEDHTVKELPPISTPQFVVRLEWFWASIQIEACADETLYLFNENKQEHQNVNKFTPTSALSKARKRKRLKENIALLASEGDVDSPYLAKRPSCERGRVSMSPNSFLDASGTPDKSSILQESTQTLSESPPKSQPAAKVTPRLQVATELLQTEKNYVGILETIIKVFKEEIEKSNQVTGPLLNPQESKIIFGNIPPIYDVHCKIRDELADIISNWKDEHSIGDVILKHADKLCKIYPPFINFFEKTKEMIAKCDKANPRFHAFLKRCLTKPECGRQTLQELLIRPVQRLPSVTLLLNDILKHTNKSNPDHGKVEKALAAVKEAMTHINEDKRKIEGKVAMFDIVYDIDNCPPNLLSFHRNFEMRADVIEITGGLSGKGDHLSLFLFSDSLEICKRRIKNLNQMKSPHHKTPHKTPQKAFKHLEMMPLTSIKRVLDVIETDECRNAFGLICRNNSEFKEKLYSFTIDCEETKKSDFLTALCKNMANTMCRADYENLMAQVDGQEFNIDMNDLGTNSISKAFKFGKRVSRAFSFNKTPRKLKRAISNMPGVMSPYHSHDNGSYVGTPGSDLRGRRLASSIDLTDGSSPLSSLTNIHEDGFPDSDTISLGAYSMQDGDSPGFSQPSPMVKRSMTKYMTLGPSSAGKYL